MRSSNVMEENVSFVKESVHDAAAQGAQYIQTPEMTGLVEKDKKGFFAKVKKEEDDSIVALAYELSKELEVYLHIGSTPIGISSDKAVNRAYLFSPKGELLARYDKLHMFDVDLDSGERWRESAVYQAGESAIRASIFGCQLGLSICYDLRFPHLYRHLARKGADILSAPSCFTRQTGRAHWHILTRARAIENGAFMIAAAQGGEHKDTRTTFGHSLIINPWGDIIAEVKHEDPDIAMATIDPQQSTEARKKIPNLQHDREFKES